MNVSQMKMTELTLKCERSELEAARLARELAEKEAKLAEYSRNMDTLNQELGRLSLKTNEESSVLQAGLDQTLIAYSNLQNTSAENEKALIGQISKLQSDHLIQMNRMMDNILQHCITKIQESVYDLQNPMHNGNQTASAEYVMTLLETTQASCTDFAGSVVKLVQVRIHVYRLPLANSTGRRPVRNDHQGEFICSSHHPAALQYQGRLAALPRRLGD